MSTALSGTHQSFSIMIGIKNPLLLSTQVNLYGKKKKSSLKSDIRNDSIQEPVEEFFSKPGQF